MISPNFELMLYLFIFLFFVLTACVFYVFKRLRRGRSLEDVLFKDFKRKIWMTISLGGVFFTLYFFSVSLSTYLPKQWKMDVFLLLYRHPVKFIYGGLCLFAVLSLSIYLTRLIVKYFYLTRGKDS